MNDFLFDPTAGEIVREPPGTGPGYWAGAPGATYDPLTDRFYLTYRYRRPRGVVPDRGAEFRIAVSDDGIRFTDLWRLEKSELASASIERGCLRRLPDGRFALYLSYVDPADQRWCVDRLEAATPDGFAITAREPLFRAPDLGLEAIKDPWVLVTGPALWMFTSIAALAVEHASAEQLHATADCYDTGLILSHTGLAVSSDGRRWEWLGSVLAATAPGRVWDGYSARIGCVLPVGNLFVAYYDGAIGVEDHYDERTGLAVSFDLRTWTRLTPDAPVLASPHATGCCRYFDVVVARGRRYHYYEFARPDGAHELRVFVR